MVLPGVQPPRPRQRKRRRRCSRLTSSKFRRRLDGLRSATTTSSLLVASLLNECIRLPTRPSSSISSSPDLRSLPRQGHARPTLASNPIARVGAELRLAPAYPWVDWVVWHVKGGADRPAGPSNQASRTTSKCIARSTVHRLPIHRSLLPSCPSTRAFPPTATTPLAQPARSRPVTALSSLTNPYPSSSTFLRATSHPSNVATSSPSPARSHPDTSPLRH